MRIGSLMGGPAWCMHAKAPRFLNMQLPSLNLRGRSLQSYSVVTMILRRRFGGLLVV